MAYTTSLPLQGPFQNDESQRLLFKIARYLAAVITGEVGFLVRGAVTTSSTKGTTVTRAGFTTGLTANQTLLAANTTRVYFIVDNRTGVDVYYRYGSAACTTAVGGYDVHILPGGGVIDDGFAGQVTFICAASAAATGVTVTEVAA